jgi:hypothetical protein
MEKSNNPKPRNFVTGLIILGLIFVIFFGLRAARAFRQFHGHRPPPPFQSGESEVDVSLIRDWMTLPYVSITYRLPPNLLYETLNIPPKGNEKKSIRQLNQEYHPEESGLVLEKVKAAILAYQSTQTSVPSSVSTPTGGP